MIFEGFSPGTAQELVRLRALRGKLLMFATSAGGVCALLRLVLMV